MPYFLNKLRKLFNFIFPKDEFLRVSLEKGNLLLINQDDYIKHTVNLSDVIEIRYGRLDSGEFGVGAYLDVITEIDEISFPHEIYGVENLLKYFKIKVPLLAPLAVNSTYVVWSKRNSRFRPRLHNEDVF